MSLGLGSIQVQQKKAAAAAGLTAADNGLSLDGSTVQLGQLSGAVGDPGALLDNRVLPLGLNSLSFGDPSDSYTQFSTQFGLDSYYQDGPLYSAFQVRKDRLTGYIGDASEYAEFAFFPDRVALVSRLAFFQIAGHASAVNGQALVLQDNITGAVEWATVGADANNGLSMDAGFVQLGGPSATPSVLLQDRFINAGAFDLNITGSNFSVFRSTSTGASGTAINGASQGASGIGVNGTSWTGYGVIGSGVTGVQGEQNVTGGAAVLGKTSLSGANGLPGLFQHLGADVATLDTIITLARAVNPTAGALPGLGASMDILITAQAGYLRAARLISKLTDAVNGTAKTEIWGNDAGTEKQHLEISGPGVVSFSQYDTLPEYADNAAALVGGLVATNIYRSGDFLKIVH